MPKTRLKGLAFVEHADRELDVICLVRLLLEKRYGIELEVANLSADAPALLCGPIPKITFYSSFYSSEFPLRRDYISAWPNTRVVSLAWEQIFSPIDQFTHRPLDDFARNNVEYLAWSTDYRDYLIGNGVDPRKITVVGHSLYQLYDMPYCRYFQTRDALAKKFNLDTIKRWIFIPENYGFLFLSDGFIGTLTSQGVPRDDLLHVRAYCRSSMAVLARWADALARRGEVEVIFRPRPAVDTDNLLRFFRDECGLSRPSFRVIKAETARDWVLAADVVMSSYSTVLIEAAIARKTIRKIEPTPIPASLRYDWCDLVSTVASAEELMAAASPGSHDGGSARLREWARGRFFASEAPIPSLVETMAAQITAAYEEYMPAPRGPHGQRMPFWLGTLQRFAGPVVRDRLYRKYVPGYLHKVSGHEKDFFGRRDIHRRTQRWTTVVYAEGGLTGKTAIGSYDSQLGPYPSSVRLKGQGGS